MTTTVKAQNLVTRPLVVICLILILLIGFVSSLLLLGEKNPLERYLSSVSWLKIEEFKIQTDWPLTPAVIKSWLPPLEGKSLLLVRPGLLIQLLQNKPWVENVSIKKEYPNRLVLDVETLKPQAITLIKGTPHFLTSNGKVIEKVSSQLLRVLDLPFISIDKEGRKWNIADVLKAYERLKKNLGEKTTISQIALGSYPYFKIFLSKPKMEVLLNFENWETQSPFLLTLLTNPPSQIGQVQRINLVFSKKAVVR